MNATLMRYRNAAIDPAGCDSNSNEFVLAPNSEDPIEMELSLAPDGHSARIDTTLLLPGGRTVQLPEGAIEAIWVAR